MDLTIAEGFALLALKDETGEKQGQFVEYGLAGSALSELILRGKLAQDQAKPKRLDIIDTETTGDRFLDLCLSTLVKAGSGKKITTYVNKLAGKSKLFREQALSLVEKGVLRTEPKSFLVFNWTQYPEADTVTEAKLEEHLAAVMFGGKAAEARDCVIIALAEKTQLLGKNFDKSAVRTHKARIKEIARGDTLAAKATVAAIDAALTAVIAATTVTTVAATTGS